MCPYFWTYVVIMLTLPLILLIKMFGKGGTKFLNYVKDFKENRRLKAVAYLQAICEIPDLTPKAAYKIYCSKCWKNHKWDLDNYYSVISPKIELLYSQHLAYLKDIKNKELTIQYNKDAIRKQRMDEYREAKWFTPLSYIISVALIGAILYLLGMGLYMGGSLVNWPVVGKWTFIILSGLVTLGAVIGILYTIIKYVFIPFFKWTSCVKLPNCGICENIKSFFRLFKYVWLLIRYILIGIGRFIGIIGNMIYSTYKKQCPIITWED